jgi:GTP cyclohydrolase I
MKKCRKKTILVGIVVPFTTACPCSHEICRFGAHNQLKIFFWIEDIIKIVEGSASGEVYSLLNWVDEKYLTEKAYENPRFVEDIVRDIAVKLNLDENFIWYSVEAENFESIHNHSTYAYVEKE